MTRSAAPPILGRVLCRLTAVLLAALSLACAAPVERIVDLRSGRVVERTELLAAIRASDFALLGEKHDNPLHHAYRGELIAALGETRAAAVAEHLPAGTTVHFDGDLRANLVAAGFEARLWDWPVHEPLFAAVARSGLTLHGGNAAREDVRAVARGGEAALPPALAALLRDAPLTSAAQAELDADLLGSHCGQLSAEHVPAMRWAQRARDAAMALALLDAQRSDGARPVLLLAGNGHVRTDYGVGQVLEARQPHARVVSVAFADDESLPAPGASAPFDYLWLTTPPPQRGDPCAGVKMPVAPAR